MDQVIDGQTILEAQTPNLLPLTPLMKPPQGLNPTRWLDECVDATFNTDIDTDIKVLCLHRRAYLGV